MGILIVIMDSIIFMLGLLNLMSYTAGQNPCEGISVGFCDFDESQVVARHPYNEVLCHKLCKLDDQCLFWRHNTAKASPVPSVVTLMNALTSTRSLATQFSQKTVYTLGTD